MRVLVLGREAMRVETAVAEIASNNIEAVGATTDAEALATIDSGEVTTLVIGAGIETASREALKATSREHEVRVIEASRGIQNFGRYLRRTLIPMLREENTRSP